MKLTYRGISYSTGTEAIQTTTTAKYRGVTYAIDNAPAAPTSNVLKYRGIAYATGTATAGKPSASEFPACVVPAFG